MPRSFFGKQIEVTTEGDVRLPVSFRLDGKLHAIREVIFSWHDSGFGNAPRTRQPRWWQRHHRNYYRVQTTEDDVFEIYFDRGTSPKNPKYRKWYVTRQL